MKPRFIFYFSFKQIDIIKYMSATNKIKQTEKVGISPHRPWWLEIVSFDYPTKLFTLKQRPRDKKEQFTQKQYFL